MQSNIGKFTYNIKNQNNQHNDKNNQQKTSIKSLCLNPNCVSPRLIDNSLDLASTSLHQNCKGWVHSLDLLRNGFNKQRNRQKNRFESIDYLQNPIQSIFHIQQFALIGWENYLFDYYKQVVKSIEEELTKIFIKTQQQINNHLKLNNQISVKIKAFCEQIEQRWEQDHQQIYNKHLRSKLIQINMKGSIKISNNQILDKKMAQIIREIKQIGQCIWNEEIQYDLNQRKIFQSKKNDLLNYGKLPTNDALMKIQQIQNCLKQKIKFIQNKDETQILCLKCQHVVKSLASSIKLRKQQCRKLILTHLTTIHADQLAVIMIKKQPVKLTIDDLKKQIMLKGIKKIMVIDKENSILNTQSACPDLYCFQILSKNNQNIAKGKYLLAESTGKDAADILIVIVLYQLSKLQLQEISLLTNDHYGQTLQPIFAKLGVQIKLINSNKLKQSL